MEDFDQTEKIGDCHAAISSVLRGQRRLPNSMGARAALVLLTIIMLLSSCSGNIVNERSKVDRRDAALDTSAYVEPEHILKLFTWKTTHTEDSSYREVTELARGESIRADRLYKRSEEGRWRYTEDRVFMDISITAEYDGPISMDVTPYLKDGQFIYAYGKTKNYTIDPDNSYYNADEINGSNSLTAEVNVSKVFTWAIVEGYDAHKYYVNVKNNTWYSLYLTQQLLSEVYEDVSDKYYNVFRNVTTMYLNINCYKTNDMSLTATAKIELKYMDGWNNIPSDELYKITGQEPPQKWTAELVDYWQVETGE